MSEEFEVVLIQVDSSTVVSRKVPKAAPVADAPSMIAELAPEPKPVDVAALVDENAPLIIDFLPSLSDEELAGLEARELAGKTRKGVMAAIAAEKESRLI